MPPKVAVVILNWNGRHFLEQFLPSVVQSTYTNLEIVVADNGSTDDSLDFVKKSYPNIKLVVNDQNYGFAGGYNVSLAHVEADYYVLLNSDVEVEAGWIEPVIKYFQADARIGACQPKLRAYHQKTHFEYAGAAGGYIDLFGYAFCKGRFFDICEADEGQYEEPASIFWATGAAMFIKADLFHQAGGFDADFFAHMEEIDLCWRMKRAGYLLYYCPESIVYHVGGGTLPQGNPRKTYLNFRNNLTMLFKNLTFWQLLTIFPIRLLLDLIAALKSLIDRKPADAKAILKAQFYFYQHFLTNLKKRKAAQAQVEQIRLADSQMNRDGWYRKSIIIDYFFKGKRKFPE